MTILHVLLKEPPRLIPIIDRVPPEFCESCGGTRDLFWSGRIMLCINCAKASATVRKLGGHMVDPGIKLDEFYRRLIARENLVRRLFRA